jgi:small subunit ribosomal protein S8
MDPLSNALSTMMNNEMRNKRECVIWPASRLIGNVLRVLQLNGYVGAFELIDDGRSGKFVVQLLGRINKIGPIKPRFPIRVEEFELWEKKYLPSRDIGLLILTTSNGIMTNVEAKNKNVGGGLLAYVY